MPMRLLAILLALATPVFAVAPARAADVATLSCVADTMPATLRDAIAKDIDRAIRAHSYDYDPKLTEQLNAVGEQCRTRFGWSPVATTNAVINARVSIGLPIAMKAARDQGIDVDKAMAIWRGFPDDFRSHRIDEAGQNQLIDAMLAANLVKRNGDAELLGRLSAYANMIEMTRQNFIAA